MSVLRASRRATRLTTRSDTEARRSSEGRSAGWKLVNTIEDAGYSGKSLRRPGIQAAFRELESGEADAPRRREAPAFWWAQWHSERRWLRACRDDDSCSISDAAREAQRLQGPRSGRGA
jgi:hypothetical protein